MSLLNANDGSARNADLFLHLCCDMYIKQNVCKNSIFKLAS